MHFGGYHIRADVLIFLIICFAFIYTHLFLFPFTPVFHEEDHLYVMHDAWRMYEGEVIYRDFFQIMYPGTQLLYLAFFYVFGLRFWIVDAIILLQAMISVILCLAISRRLISDTWYAYLPPSLYLFFGFRWLGIDGHHRAFSPIFAMLAVFVLLRERSDNRLIAAGALCGAASFFTQQRGALAVAGIAVFLIVEAVSERASVITVVKKLALVGVTYGLTLTVLILPFIAAAGPEKFFGYTLFFISNYVQDPTANYGAYILGIKGVLSQGYLISAVSLFYYAIIPLVYVAAIVYVRIARKSGSAQDGRQGLLLVSFVGLALALGTFAPNPGRLFQIAAPAVIVFGWLVFQLRPRADLPVRFAIVLLATLGVALGIRQQTHWQPGMLETPTGRIAFLSPVTLERYAWLTENARPEDAVFEVYNCAVNFPLQLDNPTEATHLLNTGYSPRWQVTGAIASLEVKKARFIIWDGNWDAEMEVLSDGEKLKPLHKYLNEHYEMRKQFTPYNNRSPQIWERKN